ncbi:3-oxoacyl-ACP synthase [Burkholderia multivorans]|nr:3-oxoacyl-ACP synthase [Burkholderia multivorans]
MCAAAEPSVAGIRISATSCYIPCARAQASTQWQDAHAAPTSPRNIVMRSIYEDVLRWRAASRSSDDPGEPAPAPAQHVSIEPTMTVTEMALLAARQAVQPLSAAADHAVDQVIVCTTSLEHDLAMSCAGRMHGEFRSTRPPLAIGQLQAVSAFLAIQMAGDMMVEDEHLGTVLVVGAERWLPPFSRLAGFIALGDGAAAAMIRRGPGAGWSVRGVSVCTPFSDRGADEWMDVQIVSDVIDQACRNAGLSARTVDRIVPPRVAPALVRTISARAGLRADRTWYPRIDDIGYLCAADPFSQLDAFSHVHRPATGERVLLWSTGVQGQAACAILEYRAD